MVIESKELTLQNGQEIILRSPQCTDAEKEKLRIQAMNEDKDSFMIAALIMSSI